MHYTYILRSKKDGKCYIGSTSDLRRRFAEHQRGDIPSTAPRRPFDLIFYEAFLHLKEAIKREKYFKEALKNSGFCHGERSEPCTEAALSPSLRSG